jgi:hypothetical protein
VTARWRSKSAPNISELLLKSIVSKGNKSIYEKKRRNHPYKTLSCPAALHRAVSEKVWPKAIEYRPVEENLDLLIVYRDNVVHFYNAFGFGTVIPLRPRQTLQEMNHHGPGG